jgi:hypothetical protein
VREAFAGVRGSLKRRFQNRCLFPLNPVAIVALSTNRFLLSRDRAVRAKLGPMNRRFAIATFLGILMIAPGFAAEEKTITGWVLDSACAITKGLKKPISSECAVACARKGSPLAILLDNGTLYWPIADTMPADGQNERLLPFAGKRVTVTGKIYKQGGSNSIVIEKIAEAGGK